MQVLARSKNVERQQSNKKSGKRKVRLEGDVGINDVERGVL